MSPGRALFRTTFTLVALVVGCGTVEVPVLGLNAGDAGVDAGVAADGGFGTLDGSDTARPGGDGDTDADYCSGSGAPNLVVTVDGGTPTCTGHLAQTAFRYALCTCEELTTDHKIVTDAFDSTQGPYDPSKPKFGGSIGANGHLNTTGLLDIGGSVWCGSPDGITTTADAGARGELHSAGKITFGAELDVGTDAWLAQGGDVQGNLWIPGTLHIPNPLDLHVNGTKNIGQTSPESVSVPLPCDCLDTPVDVAALVDHYSTENDNEAAGIKQDMFTNVHTPDGGTFTATIPCGRFFFDGVTPEAPVNLRIGGRVWMFVRGDVHTQADFVVNVPAGSELDLFIGGNVVTAGKFQIGDPSNPARARTYIGGTGTVNLQYATELAGNLYAPKATVVLGASPTTVFGSVFTKSLNASGDLTIHFDESIVKQDTNCPSVASCKTCQDCGNLACVRGACKDCLDSSDCCAPLVCRSGKCVEDIR